jgi:hypothetical protein
MKNLILALLILLTGASCVTQKRCHQKFPPEIKVITNTVIQYKDTVIYVKIPGDTVIQKDTIKVFIDKETGIISSSPSWLFSSYSKSMAQVVNGLLKHSHFQDEKELEFIIKDAIQKHSTHTTETIVQEVEVNKLKWWQKVYIWFGKLFIVVLIGVGVFLALKYLIKFPRIL